MVNQEKYFRFEHAALQTLVDFTSNMNSAKLKLIRTKNIPDVVLRMQRQYPGPGANERILPIPG